MNRTLLACLAATAAHASAHSAVAAANPDTAVRVSYADLDLGRAAGRAELDARLKAAAAEVCGTPDIRELGQVARASACTERALAGAHAQLAARAAAATAAAPAAVATNR